MKQNIVTGDEGTGVLRLPDDNAEAWTVLVYTQLARSLPFMLAGGCRFDNEEEVEFHKLLVRCWILGHKYRALQFQDLIMSELILRAGRCLTLLSVVCVAAREAVPESKVWWFMVEEAVFYAREFSNTGERDRPRLVRFKHRRESRDVCHGILRDFADAVMRTKYEDIVCARARRDSMEAWLKLMEDGGPDSTRWLNVPNPFHYCHKPPPVFAEPVVYVTQESDPSEDDFDPSDFDPSEEESTEE